MKMTFEFEIERAVGAEEAFHAVLQGPRMALEGSEGGIVRQTGAGRVYASNVSAAEKFMLPERVTMTIDPDEVRPLMVMHSWSKRPRRVMQSISAAVEEAGDKAEGLRVWVFVTEQEARPVYIDGAFIDHTSH